MTVDRISQRRVDLLIQLDDQWTGFMILALVVIAAAWCK